MVKMRSINDAFLTIRNDDPETAMTLSGLRRLVAIGKIPTVKIGRRILINYDCLLDYLNHPVELPVSDNMYGKVRKIL